MNLSQSARRTQSGFGSGEFNLSVEIGVIRG